MTAPRIIGEPVRDYDGLICALRARKAELQLSNNKVDHLAGWAPGYCEKVLGPSQVKTLGLHSLEIALTVLAMELVPAEDEQALRRMEKRYESLSMERVQHPAVHQPNGRSHRIAQTRAVQREALKLRMQKIGKKGARVSAANQMTSRSPRLRSRIARQAARARWRKVKATQQCVGKTGGKCGNST